MRAVSIFSVAILLAAASCYEMDGDVLVLTDSDIDQAIKEHEYILIEFYAPWCGHCKHLAPEYAKAATKLSKLDKPIALAKVDATEQRESASRFGVRGYPTLKWFVNGKESEYGGGRTEAEIVGWVKKKSGPALKELSGQEAVENFKNGASVVLVGFVAQDSNEHKLLDAAARALEDVEVGVVFDADLAATFGASQPGLVLFKDFDEGKNTFEGQFESDAIQTFVKGNSLPLVSTFSQESAPKLFGSGIESHFLYFNHETADSHSGVLAELKAVAGDYKGKTLFVYVPSTESRVMSYFDLTEGDLPAAVLVSMGEGDMKKFAFTSALTAENIRAHVAAFHSGELKPTLKSEEIPEDNTGPVKVVVGKNFQELVMDNTKDVLLEFYAPWCGHCKALTPVWEQLGAHYANNDNIVIAKVDATANDVDHPKVSVKGFPTILFFAGNDKANPRAYEGGRDVESFIKYLDENASAPAEAHHTHDRTEL